MPPEPYAAEATLRTSSARDRKGELPIDVAEVEFDGLRAEEQGSGRLLVRRPLRHHKGDLELLRRQRAQRVVGGWLGDVTGRSEFGACLLGPRVGARGFEEGERVVQGGTSVRPAARPPAAHAEAEQRPRTLEGHVWAVQVECGLELVLVFGLVGEQPATSGSRRRRPAQPVLGGSALQHGQHALGFLEGAGSDARFDVVRRAMVDGRETEVEPLFEPLAFAQVDDRAISATERQLEQPQSGGPEDLDRGRARSPCVVERCGGVGPAVLLVAEDRLDACQHDQRE